MKKYFLIIILFICPVVTQATEYMQFSEFEIAQSKIKYSLLDNQISEQKQQASDEITYTGGSSNVKSTDYKSPGKAFAMSLILPGWGQHYTGGSKLKSLAFLGTEVASWVFYFKWQKDADDLTDVFEAFNNEHWIESRYDSMVAWTYIPLWNDGTVTPEMSHRLPDSKTQQYYEMTGKYDQFVWGWDDAELISDNLVFEDYSAVNPFLQVTGEGVPSSAKRDAYEIMRDDANNKYDQARRMIYVSMINRMFSAFEAMISAKKHNKNSSSAKTLSSLSAEASLKSFYVKRDTPFITLKMKF